MSPSLTPCMQHVCLPVSHHACTTHVSQSHTMHAPRMSPSLTPCMHHACLPVSHHACITHVSQSHNMHAPRMSPSLTTCMHHACLPVSHHACTTHVSQSRTMLTVPPGVTEFMHQEPIQGAWKPCIRRCYRQTQHLYVLRSTPRMVTDHPSLLVTMHSVVTGAHAHRPCPCASCGCPDRDR